MFVVCSQDTEKNKPCFGIWAEFAESELRFLAGSEQAGKLDELFFKLRELLGEFDQFIDNFNVVFQNLSKGLQSQNFTSNVGLDL